MRLRLCVAMAVVPAAMGAVAAEASPEQVFGLLAYRTVRSQPFIPGQAAPLGLDMTVVVRADDHPAVLGYAQVQLWRGRVDKVDTADAIVAGAANSARVTAAGQRVEAPCPGGGCLDAVNPGKAEARILVYGQSSQGVNAVFVVGRGDALDYEVRVKDGWVVKRFQLSSRAVLSQDSAAAGAFAAVAGVELMGAPSAPGGRWGSVAVAFPPCGNAVAGLRISVGRGAGTATLSGGVENRSMPCPTTAPDVQSTPLRLDGRAHGPTNWRLHGTSAGETSGSLVRLLVIDLPRKLPVPRTWRTWGWA